MASRFTYTFWPILGLKKRLPSSFASLCCDAQQKILKQEYWINYSKGVHAMQHSAAQFPATSADIMEVWAQRALKQRAAFEAIAAYMCQR